MSRSGFKAHAVDAQGNVLTSASVTVRDQSGVVISPSALFTAYSGSGTHASNPFTATGGLISFYVDGSQVVTVSAVSGGTSQTWSNVVLNELIDTTSFATSAQGAKADSATQPSDLGTAAATDSTDYATAAQGTKADSALQAADVGTAAAQDSTAFATAAQGALADSATQPADLGTAAAADLTTGATDTTSGRVLKVGDGGLISNLQVRQSKTSGAGASYVKIATINSPDSYDRLELSCRVETFSTPDKSAELKISCSVPTNLTTIRGNSFLIEGDPSSSPILSVFTLGLDVYVEIDSFTTVVTHAYSTCSFTLHNNNFTTTDPRGGTEIEFQIDKIWTDRAYKPETSLGSGVSRKMKNKSGGAIADQAQVAGSSLKAVYTDSSGVEQENPATIGGTWINVSGMSLADDEAAEFTKL